MKEQEIIEGNKLIAEFMGYRQFDNGMGNTYKNIKQEYNDGLYRFISGTLETQLLFHESWDWLIPVISKIYESNEYYKWKETSGQFEKEVFINTKFIKETWKQVVEFLTWLNTSKA